ncbi:hypothetical protein [Chitinophaga niabensis]|uniref:Uncharacterized protein n=1 Tax=Chitinophaga niabensis TaxID=536979 RepID=A0A1N6D0P9_9BACT|nr:hypothetical protein [Chitinophaga niabensis]SIN64294.1 hypothetical protein SAMN04488055_0037 [Chitinophaga niabensis]
MKKILSIFAVTLLPILVHGQDYYRLPDNSYVSQQFVTLPATLLAMYLIASFILKLIKTNLDHRLKSKMLEKGIPEQFFQQNDKDDRVQAFRSFLLLAGIGIGLTLVYYTLPIGIHSMAIMAFCIALSYLVYFFYLKK